MSTSTAISKSYIVELLNLRRDCSIVDGAANARFCSILVNQLEFKEWDSNSSLLMHVLKEYWVAIVYELDWYLTALGVAPIKIVKRAITVGDETKEENVPIVPHPSTWDMTVELTPDGQTYVQFKSTKDDKPIFAIHSSIRKGPQFDGSIISDLSILYDEWKALIRSEKICDSAIAECVAPTLYVEHPPPGANAPLAKRGRRMATLDEDHNTNIVELSDEEEGETVKRHVPYRLVIATMDTAEHVDPATNVAYIADNLKLASAPRAPTIPPWLSDRRKQFEQNVGVVFKVPNSFLGGSKDGALNGMFS